MADTAFSVIVLAAGMGTRMQSDVPKVMHPLAGRPMILHGLATLAALSPAPQSIAVVVGPGMDQVAAAVAPWPTAVQTQRLGTAHAVNAARDLVPRHGTVLVVYGDTPLVSAATYERLLAARDTDTAVAVMGFRPADPSRYGRLIVGDDGDLGAIVEHRDATPEQQAIGLCNAGIMALDGELLFALIDRIGNGNAKGEYYLTDVVALARADGGRCAMVEADVTEVMGIDSRAGLAAAEAIVQRELRGRAMAGGATLIDPAAVWLCHDTVIGPDVVIHPDVVFGPGVHVERGAEIRAFCHLEGTRVGAGAQVGPFARLRPGAEIGPAARVGNFVEVKNAVVGDGAKINHLSYIGDAAIGAGANIGAGTITCNYDGYGKFRTVIGAGAFIGSNATLMAPLTIGAGAFVAGGSAISQDVPADALAIGRGRQETKAGWAARRRRLKDAEKAAGKKT